MKTDLQNGLDKAIAHLRHEYSGLRIGRATPALVEDIMIDVTAYGSQMEVKGVASISCPDPKTIRIEPWDKGVMRDLEKGLQNSSLGITPQNMGDCLLLPIPPMTEERRRDLVKVVHAEAEKAKITVRNARQEALKQIKHQKDEKEISEDVAKDLESDVQEMVDKTNKEIGEIATKKEKDIMTV